MGKNKISTEMTIKKFIKEIIEYLKRIFFRRRYCFYIQCLCNHKGFRREFVEEIVTLKAISKEPYSPREEDGMIVIH